MHLLGACVVSAGEGATRRRQKKLYHGMLYIGVHLLKFMLVETVSTALVTDTTRL